jgi:zinc/manganese transport system substrate-binding protein
VRLGWLAVVLVAALALAGCDRSGPAPAPGGAAGHTRLDVVAAEDFWGSLAAQLAGNRAVVHSIIVNPGTDPHSYQPDARDARELAQANLAIVNGIGYDNWASQLLRASQSDGRVVLDVGRTLGLRDGANPHRWYYPADVRAVIGAIVADYDRLDPADAPYFAAQKRHLLDIGLARYDRLRDEIHVRFAGTPVGYSESIFQGLGVDLGLRLLTPYSFTQAIAEGTDVSAADKETVDAQAQHRRIKVWVMNSQNVTPDVQRVDQLAAEHHIPIATVTETLSPAGDSFQGWQVRELEGLLRALRRASASGS